MKINLVFLFAVLSICNFTSCDISDGTTIIDEKFSPFYLKLNQEGNLLDIRHGLTHQASSNISIPDPCDWLFKNCANDNKVDTLYLASTFGTDELGHFNFLITNLPYSNELDIDADDIISRLMNELPFKDGLSQLATGSLTQGIQNGNVYIGKSQFMYGYAYKQFNWVNFKITEVNEEDFHGEKVIGIKFSFAYSIFNDKGASTALMDGEGYLPFGLHGQK